MGIVDIDRINRVVKLAQDELMGARLVDPSLAERIDPWLDGYTVEASRLAGLEAHIRSADEGWTPARFAEHNMTTLARILNPGGRYVPRSLSPEPRL